MFTWTLKKMECNILGPPIALCCGSTYMFGRKLGAFIKLESSFASRQHCTIKINPDGACIIDHKTLNGTYIGTDRVPSEREIPLRTGDAIGIGLPANEFSPQPYYVIYKSDVDPEVVEILDTCELDATVPFLKDDNPFTRRSNDRNVLLGRGYDLARRDVPLSKKKPQVPRCLSLKKLKKEESDFSQTVRHPVQPLPNPVDRNLESWNSGIRSCSLPEEVRVIIEGSPFAIDVGKAFAGGAITPERNPLSKSHQMPTLNITSGNDGSDSSVIGPSPSPQAQADNGPNNGEYSICDDIIVIDSDVDEDELPCSQFFSSMKIELGDIKVSPSGNSNKSLADGVAIPDSESAEESGKCSVSPVAYSPPISPLFIHSQLSPETFLSRVENRNDEDIFCKEFLDDENLLEALMTQIELDKFQDLPSTDSSSEVKLGEAVPNPTPPEPCLAVDSKVKSSPVQHKFDSSSSSKMQSNAGDTQVTSNKLSTKRKKEISLDKSDEPKIKSCRVSKRLSAQETIKVPERVKRKSRSNCSFSKDQMKMIVEAGKKLEGTVSSRRQRTKHAEKPYNLRASEKKKIKELRKKKLQEVALAEKTKRHEDRPSLENGERSNLDKCFVKVTDVNRGAILIDMIPLKDQRSRSKRLSKGNKTELEKAPQPDEDTVKPIEPSLNAGSKSDIISDNSKENEERTKQIGDFGEIFKRASLRIKNIGNVQVEAVTRVSSGKGKRSSEGSSKVKQNVKTAVGEQRDSEAPAKRRSILKSQNRQGSRKSVKFESPEQLTSVKYYERDLKRSDAVHHVREREVVYLKGSPKTPSSLIQLFCKWNSKWIEESVHTEDLPPLLQQEFPNPSPVVASYQNYHEYQNTLLPLQVFELWESIVREVLRKKGSVFVGGVRSTNESQDKMMEDISVTSYARDGDETLKQGDLVIVKAVDISQKSCAYTRSHKSEGQSKTSMWLSFGYIPAQPLRKPLQNSDLASVDQFKRLCASGGFDKKKSGQIYAVNFQVLVRAKTLKFWRPGVEISLVPCVNILGELKLFQTLERLIFSPLGPLVLSPSTFHPMENSQDYPFKQQQFLNSEQKSAVNYCTRMVLGPQPSIALIHGPPGTGKSVVITHLVLTVLEELKKDKHRMRILICASSNFAIDQLVSRLLSIRQKLDKNKFNMVRVGNYDMMTDESKLISLKALSERMLEQFGHSTMAKAEVERLNKRVKYLMRSHLESGAGNDVLQQEVIDTKRYLRELQLLMDKKADRSVRCNLLRRYEREILLKADIVATTLSSSVSYSILQHLAVREKKPFGCCIIDEATQATELQTLMPTLLNVDKFVLIGDDKQLSPVVLSQKAKAEGLEVSLFERILGNWKNKKSKGAPLFSLKRQYRMHSEIASFPSRCFYSGSLISERPLSHRGASSLHPYLVFSHSFLQQYDGNSNVEEGELAVRLISTIRGRKTCQSLSIGIISPYQNQKDLILRLLRENKLESEVSVMTVDGAQGQERDVILLSCVRSHGVGFMSDSRRVNVALTRAKHALFVLANFTSLRENHIWRDLLSDASGRKLVIGVNKVLSKNTLKSMLFQST